MFDSNFFFVLSTIWWVQVDHVLGEAGNQLIGRLLQFLFDIVLEKGLSIVSPIVWIGPFSPTNRRHWLLPIIINLFDFLHYFQGLFATQIREKLFDMWKLLNRNLIIELLMIWTMILVILRNDFFFSFFVRITICHLLLLLVLMKLKLATGTSSWQVGEWMKLLSRCGCKSTYTFIVQIAILTARIWKRIIVLLSLSFFILDIQSKLAYFAFTILCAHCRFLTWSKMALSPNLRILFMIRL